MYLPAVLSLLLVTADGFCWYDVAILADGAPTVPVPAPSVCCRWSYLGMTYPLLVPGGRSLSGSAYLFPELPVKSWIELPVYPVSKLRKLK